MRFVKMIEMTNRSWKIFGILAVIGCLSGIYHYSCLFGFLLGIGVALLLNYRNTTYWNDVLDTKIARKGIGTSHFMVNYLIMAFTLILCAFYPQYLNIFLCALGMSLIKISIILNEVVLKKD